MGRDLREVPTWPVAGHMRHWVGGSGFSEKGTEAGGWGSGVRGTAVGQAEDEGRGEIAEGFAAHLNVTEATGASRDHTAFKGAP